MLYLLVLLNLALEIRSDPLLDIAIHAGGGGLQKWRPKSPMGPMGLGGSPYDIYRLAPPPGLTTWNHWQQFGVQKAPPQQQSEQGGGKKKKVKAPPTPEKEEEEEELVVKGEELYGKFLCRGKLIEVPSLVNAEKKGACSDKSPRCKHHCFWRKAGLLTSKGEVIQDKAGEVLGMFPEGAREGLKNDFLNECKGMLKGKKCKDFLEFDTCVLRIYSKHCLHSDDEANSASPPQPPPSQIQIPFQPPSMNPTPQALEIPEGLDPAPNSKKKSKKSKKKKKEASSSESGEIDMSQLPVPPGVPFNQTGLKNKGYQYSYHYKLPPTFSGPHAYTYTVYGEPGLNDEQLAPPMGKKKGGEGMGGMGKQSPTDEPLAEFVNNARMNPPKKHRALLGFRCKGEPLKFSQRYLEKGAMCINSKFKSYSCRKVCHLSALGVIQKDGEFNEEKFGEIFTDGAQSKEFLDGFKLCKRMAFPYKLSNNCGAIEPMLDCIRTLFQTVCEEPVPEDYDIYRECGDKTISYFDDYKAAWSGCSILTTFNCRRTCQYVKLGLLNSEDGSFNMEEVDAYVGRTFEGKEVQEGFKKVFRKCDAGGWRNYTVMDGCEGASPLIKCLHDGHNEVCFKNQPELYIPHPEI